MLEKCSRSVRFWVDREQSFGRDWRNLVQIENLEGGGFGVDFFDEAFEDAVFVEDEGAAEGALDGFAVHFLFTPGAEVLQELRGGVGEEAEGQVVFAAEAGVGFDAVFADTDDVVTGGREGFVVVAEGAGFGRASGGVVFGIEVDDGLAAFSDEVF